jgi:hypothetical protein
MKSDTAFARRYQTGHTVCCCFDYFIDVPLMSQQGKYDAFSLVYYKTESVVARREKSEHNTPLLRQIYKYFDVEKKGKYSFPVLCDLITVVVIVDEMRHSKS